MNYVVESSRSKGIKKLSMFPPFDVALIDHQMPGTHGMKMAKAIHSLHPNTPIILYSSIDRHILSSPFITRHLHKPIKQEALFGALYSVLKPPSTKEQRVVTIPRSFNAHSQIRVAVIDPNRIHRKIIKRLVSQLGYTVESYIDVSSFLNAMPLFAFTTVLIDIETGTALQECTQALSTQYPATSIITLSTRERLEKPGQSYTEQIVGHLQKPIQMTALRHVFSKLTLEPIEQMHSNNPQSHI